eukprot:3668731-Amphidinium_carterae.3
MSFGGKSSYNPFRELQLRRFLTTGSCASILGWTFKILTTIRIYALRGRCGSYFTSELGGRGTPAIQGAAWKIHILKKAVAYTKEFKAQLECRSLY